MTEPGIAFSLAIPVVRSALRTAKRRRELSLRVPYDAHTHN